MTSPAIITGSLLLAAGIPSVHCQDIPITGPETPELVGIDQVVQRYVAEHKAPGAAICIAKDGRIVYARGFGWADLEQRVPVQPDSLSPDSSTARCPAPGWS